MREWLTATIAAAAIAAFFAWRGWWWAAAGTAVPWLAVALFFRSPLRRIRRDLPAGAMLSPADGTVTAVEEVEHSEAVAGPATVIRIFLSVLNVHVNRSPCDGRITALSHTPGRFHDARSPRSATENECQLITMERDGGRLVGIRQIAGKVARRIVCDLERGDVLRRGEPFGMIKFGSGTELILPRHRPQDAGVLDHGYQITVHVRPGDKVRAGLTTLATLSSQTPASCGRVKP